MVSSSEPAVTNARRPDRFVGVPYREDSTSIFTNEQICSHQLMALTRVARSLCFSLHYFVPVPVDAVEEQSSLAVAFGRVYCLLTHPYSTRWITS